jgi:hypothetical protein
MATGCYDIMIGHDSRDIAQRATLAVGSASCPGAAQTVGRGGRRACVSRRSILVHLLGVPSRSVRRVTLYINGRRQGVLRGPRSSVRVRLSGRPRATIGLRLVILAGSGHTLVDYRTYHTCAPRRAHRLTRSRGVR